MLKNECILACVYLHPKYNPLLSQEEKIIAIRHISYLWQRVQTLTLPDMFGVQPLLQEDPADSENDCENIDELLNLRKKRSTLPIPDSTSALSHSVNKYEKLLLTSNIDATNPMQFWRNRRDTDYELYNVATVIFAVAPTQVSVERAFSGLSFILNPQRTRLNADILNNIMIIRQNREIFELCGLIESDSSASE